MSPTPTSTLKRLAIAVAVSGAALTATPALANAASTCTFDPNAFPLPRVDVFDGSGTASLTVGRQGPFIAIADGGGAKQLCAGPGGSLATIFNTDTIVVHGTAPSTEGIAFVVDAGLAPGKTTEADGHSEIETFILNNGVPFGMLDVRGTVGPDTMRVSGRGDVMLGDDNDVDIHAHDATQVRLEGEAGNDFLSGRGGFPATSPGPATTRVEIFGGDVSNTFSSGEDTVVDGPQRSDLVVGDDGNDTLFSADGQILDNVQGGFDFDTATVDSADQAFGVERLTTVVGRLKLDRTAITARAGRPAQMTLQWTHPKAWKQLRTLQLTANDAGNAIGSIRINPARARISGHGALAAARGSTVGHRGKTVIAHLRLRANKRLAGRRLRLAVQATDIHGHRQIEPVAGSLTVTK